MKIFPITSINNFFPDPNKVVKFANSLEYTKSEKGSYPGKRTKNLSEIDYDFFNKTILSILSMYFENIENISYSDTYLQFHKIKPFSKSLTDIRNKGWIHHDRVTLGGLVYLNKKSNPNSGTHLFVPKKEPVDNKSAVKTKLDFYNKNKIDIKKYEKEMKKLENKFIKTHEFKNIYNTLVAFDGFQWHNINNMVSSLKEDRLTLVFFIGKITTVDYPRLRLDQIQNLDI